MDSQAHYYNEKIKKGYFNHDPWPCKIVWHAVNLRCKAPDTPLCCTVLKMKDLDDPWAKIVGICPINQKAKEILNAKRQNRPRAVSV